MAAEQAKAIPKFASFNAGKKLQKDDRKETRDVKESTHKSSQREVRSASRHRDRSKDRDHHSKKESNHERPAKRQRRDDRDDREPRADRIHTRDLVFGDQRAHPPRDCSYVPQSNTFRIDLVGDHSNLKYRSLHKYDVPAYRRSGRGFVLGASDYRIDRRQSDEKTIVLVRTHHVDSERKDPVKTFKLPNSSKTVLIRPIPSLHDSMATQKGFVALDDKQRSDADHDLSGEHLSLATEREHSDSSDDEMPGRKSSEEVLDDPHLRIVKEQNARLQRQVEANPRVGDYWIQLIDHQAAVLGLSHDEFSARLSPQQQRSLADIRLTIYDKALSNFGPNDEAYVRLWQGLLTEGAKVWDVRKQDAKWESALQKTHGHPELWLGRLTFVQSNAAVFSFEQCKAIFIKALRSAGERTLQSSSSTIVMHIFLRFTVFIRSAGYHELAEALWQAVLELRFFSPKQSSEDPSKNLESFLEFWDDENSRIGELGAHGWSQTALEDRSTLISHSKLDLDIPSPPGVTLKTLRDGEKSKATSLRHPGRPLDEDGVDDLYHTILVNDLRDVPLNPTAVSDPSLVLSAFFHYLGLPSMDELNTEAYRFLMDPWTSRNSVAIPLLDTAWTFRALDLILEASPDNIDLAEYYLGLRTQFTICEGHNAFELEGTDSTSTESLSASGLLASQNNLYHSHLGPTAPIIASLPAFFDVKSSRKAAKKLLKKNSTSIQLYNAYALMELKLGNAQTAEQIWTPALQIGQQVPSEQHETVRIWHSWIHHALQKDSTFKTATHILSKVGAASSEDTSRDLTSSIVLRVRRHLTEGRDASLLAQNAQTFVRYADLLAILEYIHNDQNIDLTVANYSRSLTALATSRLQNSAAREKLHECRTHLMSLHMRSVQVYKPSTIREVLLESINTFPTNMTFMNLFIENEKRFNIDDRVRSLFVDLIEDNNTNNILLCARYIEFEKQRSKLRNIGGANVRTAFERVLGTPLGRLLQDIWTDYVEFEIESGEHERAKNVFFRGLQCLPGCKWYILMGLNDLKTLSREERQGILKFLIDKEIRMHQDIEDMQGIE